MPYLSDITSALNKRTRSDSHTSQLPSSTTALYPAAADNSSSAALLTPAAPGNLRHEGRPRKLRGEGGQRAALFFSVFSVVICIDVNDGEIASSYGRDGVQDGSILPALFAPQTPLGLHPCLWFMSLHDVPLWSQMASTSFGGIIEQSHPSSP